MMMNCYFSFVLVAMSTCQEAWVWLAPILIGVFFAIRALKATEGKKLGVIGMKDAGKTTYLSHLGLVEKDFGTTQTSYEAKTVHVGNRELEIAAGEDIGGEDEYVRFYKPWLVGAEKKDIIIFIFNGYRYLNEEDYGKNTRSRLDFIYQNYKQANSDVKEFKNIVLLASHLDEYKNKDVKQMINEIKKSVASKEYFALFKNNFSAVDLRDKKIVDEINKKIFA